MITTDALSIERIRRHLTGSIIGRHIYLFGEVDSTNARLKSLARAGARAGTVVIADGQSAGRGWFSPSGVNLYASVLFRPQAPAAELPVFCLIAALALADTIKDFGGEPSVEWPNDVLVGSKKVGASLLETAVNADAVDYVIVGIGVNLNVDASVLRSALGPSGPCATSLAAATGHEIDRNRFAATYLNHLDRWVYVWEMQGAESIVSAWRRETLARPPALNSEQVYLRA